MKSKNKMLTLDGGISSYLLKTKTLFQIESPSLMTKIWL